MITPHLLQVRETLLGKHGYAASADARISYQTLYKTLTAFEADLHQHIHLENNILFPRAIATEQAQ
jgi:regulator of cell morphogenesis and NO signaling